MSFLEYSQIIFNISVSLAAVIFIVITLTVGVSLIKLLKAAKKGIETIKQESVALQEKLRHVLKEISLTHITSLVMQWFKKKKSIKNK